MAAALPAAAAGAKIGADEAAGVIKSVLNALNHDILTVRWERDPKKHDKMRLASVDFHVTNGLVLGMVLLGLAWEAANWFASGGIFNSSSPENVILTDALLAPEQYVTIFLSDIFGKPITNPDGSQKSVQVPATFGAAYNQMMRNLTVAGPGTLAQGMVNLVGRLQKTG